MTDLPLPLYGDGSQHWRSNNSGFQKNGHNNTARLILAFKSDKQNSSMESMQQKTNLFDLLKDDNLV